MTATFEIACDNAAFDDCSGAEIARILRDLAERIEGMGFSSASAFDRNLALRDANGNKVGNFRVTL